MVNVLIVGSGGTGIKTLLHTKKLIIDQRSDLHLPNNIQLLGLDTNENQEKIPGINTAVGAGKWQRTERDKGKYTGALMLNSTEYLWTGGVLIDYALGNQATGDPGMPKEEMDAHAWFNHSYFRGHRNLLQVAAGAGQYRQVGRLALDFALATGEASPFYSTLSEKIKNLQTNFLVFIIGSLAGGTGAAQYIDLAHLVRELAFKNGRTVLATYAMLALPEAFKDTKGAFLNDAMHARTTAGLRELQRFMEVQYNDMGYLMEYGHGPNGVAFSGRTRGALFENIYLFGERFQRQNNPAFPLNVDIMYGVCASMAQWCVALADELAGDPFLRSAVNRYHGLQDLEARWDRQTNELGGYSPNYVASTGSYSVVLPVASIIEEWTARFALEQVLDRLVPMDKTGILVDNCFGGESNGSGAQKAEKDWTVHPCPAAMDAGTTVKNFDPISLAEKPENASTVVGELKRRTAEKWRPILSTSGIPAAIADTLPSDETEKSVYFYNKNASGILADPLKGGQVPPESKKGYPTRSAGAARQVALRCDTKLNNLLSGYREGMVSCCSKQVDTYRNDLLAFVEKTLNGYENLDDPKYAGPNRAGKAGWLLSYLKRRVDDLDSALIIWKEAEKGKRPIASEPSKNLNEDLYGDHLIRILLRIEPSAFGRKVVFNFKYHENSSSFVNMSHDEKKQKDYMREVQSLYERELWHLWWLMEYYLIWQFRDFTHQLHASLLATVLILRGDKDSVKTSLDEQRNILRQNRIDAQHWSKVREIVQQSQWEDGKYGEQIKLNLQTELHPWQKVLKDFNWKTGLEMKNSNTENAYPEAKVRLYVNGFDLAKEGSLQTNEISPYTESSSKDDKDKNEIAAEANRARIRERCLKVFHGAWDDLNILDYLYETYHGDYPKNSRGFAEELAANCDVLLPYNPALEVLRFTYLLAPQISGNAIPENENGNLPARVDPRREWLSLVDQHIREQLGVNQNNYTGLMEHTDTTAITLFALVDWIQMESLGAFTDGKRTYINYESDPRKDGLSRPLEHIFAAEQRVAVHDENIPGRPIRLVQPRVTALFDESNRLERFLNACVLGFVNQDFDAAAGDLNNAGNLMQVVIPPEPGELDKLHNPVTTPYKYWLNIPSYFRNDKVPYIIGAETACLCSSEFSTGGLDIADMHKKLEKAIRRKLMDLHTNQYADLWSRGEGYAKGVIFEKEYRASGQEDILDKLLYLVLMDQYKDFHKRLEDYEVEYVKINFRDAYAKAAKEHEARLISIFKQMLEDHVKMLAGL